MNLEQQLSAMDSPVEHIRVYYYERRSLVVYLDEERLTSVDASRSMFEKIRALRDQKDAMGIRTLILSQVDDVVLQKTAALKILMRTGEVAVRENAVYFTEGETALPSELVDECISLALQYPLSLTTEPEFLTLKAFWVWGKALYQSVGANLFEEELIKIILEGYKKAPGTLLKMLQSKNTSYVVPRQVQQLFPHVSIEGRTEQL